MLKILALIVATPALAGQPSWLTGTTQSRDGNQFAAVCEGRGATLDIARENALNSCDALASRQLSSEVKVKSLSIETEREARFHSEVANEVTITGLKCIPLNESFEAIKDDSIRLYVQCRYDLAKAMVKSAEVDNGAFNSSQIASSIAVNSYLNVSVATTPKCDDILIRGGLPRSVRCDDNPIMVNLRDSDTELVIRAKGYDPITLHKPFKETIYVKFTK